MLCERQNGKNCHLHFPQCFVNNICIAMAETDAFGTSKWQKLSFALPPMLCKEHLLCNARNRCFVNVQMAETVIFIFSDASWMALVTKTAETVICTFSNTSWMTQASQQQKRLHGLTPTLGEWHWRHKWFLTLAFSQTQNCLTRNEKKRNCEISRNLRRNLRRSCQNLWERRAGNEGQ